MEKINKLLTHAFTFDIVPLVLEETYFAGHTFEYKWKTKQKAQFGKRNAEMCNGKNGEAHLHATTWAEHHRGRGPGPTTSPPGKGGGQASQLGYSRTLGAPTPQAAWPGPILLRWLHGSLPRRYTVVS